MTPEPQLEERLRAALGRPHGAAWPDERGAFDRFLRHRNRRGRILAGQAAVVMIVALALAVVTPRLLPGGSLTPVTPPAPGQVLRAPNGGFEVAVPAGWTRNTRMLVGPFGDPGSGVALRPKRKAPAPGSPCGPSGRPPTPSWRSPRPSSARPSTRGPSPAAPTRRRRSPPTR